MKMTEAEQSRKYALAVALLRDFASDRCALCDHLGDVMRTAARTLKELDEPTEET